MVNIRTKGQTGEREIVDMLNDIYKELYEELGKTFQKNKHGKSIPIAQRNQNQSAVGGCDISNTCGYAIEVKRHETLQINTWWKQTIKSACEVKKFPVLLYRQSRKPWRAVVLANPLRQFQEEPVHQIMCDISIEDFKAMFKNHARQYLIQYGEAT